MFCALEAGCPVLPDTVSGRATVIAALGPSKLETKLVLEPSNLPAFPSAKQIADCKTPGASQDAFETCVLSAFGSKGMAPA